MARSHTFKGISGKEYEYYLTSFDEVNHAPLRSGTYVVTVLCSSGPVFLYCREARCLREALLSESLPDQRKICRRLALYTRSDPDQDNKPARDAEVQDLMLYSRFGSGEAMRSDGGFGDQD
ncbi:MAG: hypothetical protein JOY64_09815 [Alphaproteobacteria bacterium]|nr:hypothetical protein [Alphaproteobacteria bacterium]MBV8407916.1 hypothetical protein [Alphaproteobacteria bacterium]